MFTSILSTATGSLGVESALICVGAAIALGLFIAVVYSVTGDHTRSFAVSLALFPAIVAVVILMVNGNLGTGVAVMGAFSLVRFRSVPGSAREILTIFFTMAVGLALGTGYVTFATFFTAVICAALFVLTKTGFGRESALNKELKITIPESLDYTDALTDIFASYTKSSELTRVKTTNLGSMFELTYRIALKDAGKEKEFIDRLRERNGNLTIVCSRVKTVSEEL